MEDGVEPFKCCSFHTGKESLETKFIKLFLPKQLSHWQESLETKFIKLFLPKFEFQPIADQHVL